MDVAQIMRKFAEKNRSQDLDLETIVQGLAASQAAKEEHSEADEVQPQ